MYRQSLSIRLFEQKGQAIVGASINDDDVLDGEDVASGYIYVLRSLSDDPQIAGIKDLHKIGFSRGPVSSGSRTPKSRRRTSWPLSMLSRAIRPST